MLGTALRLHDLGAKGLWGDEIAQVRWSSTSIPQIYESRLPYADGALDLYLTHFLLRLGQVEFVLRFPAAFFGILSIPLTYQVGRLLLGTRTGYLAALFLACLPYHVRYSQELRAYALLVLLTLLSLWFFLKVLRRGAWRDCAGWLAATELGLYTHLSLLFVLSAEVITATVVCVRGRASASAGRPSYVLPHVWRLSLSVALILLLWLPDVLPALPNLTGRLAASGAPPSALGPAATGSGSDLASGLWTDVRALSTTLSREFSGSRRNTVPVLTLVGLGLLGAFFRRQHRTAALLGLLVLVSPLPAAPLRYTFSSRYFIIVLPAFVSLMGHGAETLTGLAVWFVSRWQERFAQAMGKVVLVTLALFVVAMDVAPLRAGYAETRQNWREAASLVLRFVHSDDIVACRDWAMSNLTYYAPRLPNVHRVTDSPDDLAQLFTDSDCLWFARDDWLLSTRQPQEDWVADHRFLTVNLGGVLVSVGCRQGPLEATTQLKIVEMAADRLPTAQMSLTLGELYYQQGQMGPAAAQFRQAARLEPQWGIAHTKLGNAYRSMGALSEAEESYLQSIRVDPLYVGAYLNLGGIYEAQGRTAQALALYETAVQTVPDSSWAHSVLGTAFLQLGNADDAITHLERAAELEPGNVAWLLALADGYRKVGQTEKAIGLYRRVLAMQPGNRRATEALRALSP